MEWDECHGMFYNNTTDVLLLSLSRIPSHMYIDMLYLNMYIRRKILHNAYLYWLFTVICLDLLLVHTFFLVWFEKGKIPVLGLVER